MAKVDTYTLNDMRPDPDSPGDYLVGGIYGGPFNIWGLNNKPVAEVIAAIEEASSHTSYDLNIPLLNPIFKYEEHNGYDGWETRIDIIGDRRATPEEVAAYLPWKAAKEKKAQETAAKRKANEAEQARIKKAKDDAKALARAKKAFPDMFRLDKQ